MPKPRRLADGRWGCRVDGPPHPDGRRSQVRVVEDTRGEALVRVHGTQGQRLAHATAAKKGPTLEGFATRWMAGHLPNIAGTTARRYRGIVEGHIIGDPIAGIRLGDLTAQDGRDWLARLRSKPGRSTATLSNRSLRHCLALVNQILRAAVAWDEVDANPLVDVERPKVRKDPTKIKCWDRNEVALFRDEMSRSQAPNAGVWLAAVNLTLATGLRRGELAGLIWSDVDLDNKQITVRRSRLGPGLNTTEPKSAASNRTIPLSSRAIGFLADLRTIQDGDRAVLGSGRADTGFVLVLPNGQPPNPDSITQRFRRDCASAGVAHITFHGLRHTFATLALVKGIALHVVSRCLGHSSEAITLAQYAHMLPGATVEAMQVAADFIFGGDPEQPNRPIS